MPYQPTVRYEKNFTINFHTLIKFSICFWADTKFNSNTRANNKWLDSLKILQLDQQLFAIKDRLLADTNVFIRQNYPDKIRVNDHVGERVYGDAKPFIIIGGYPMIIDNKTETFKIIGLTNLLSNEFISSIHILSPNDPTTTAIYGSAALDGVIVMVLSKKKYLKIFKQLQLKSNY